ncbi:serine/threonine protein kinase, partial [Ilumatobacter sp.]|uniref:serine/threonine protein kinase n=1 Tax=Ilumatobacter sp. TaxID=1967498 RepID=UPI003AF5DC16
MNISDSPPGGQIEPSELFGLSVADQYRVVSLVSEGANTTVFDAVDDATGRTVTVKLIRPEMTATRTFRTHFDETMRRVAALSHPNIAALFDWGTTDVHGVETAFVVAEQLTGGSLRDMFDRSRQLSPSQALAVGLDTCRALDYAHRRGFVHTELTPSKLVFGDDRRLRITDFGLAWLLSSESWQQPESVDNHTAWYASPEQGLSRPIDGKTDVYALCLAMHEAVTGELPFKKDSTVATLAARVGKLMPVSADLGPLAAVLEHAGRPEADERASAAEFGKGLVQTAGKLPRPEPLPLLSTGLFDTPVEQLRSPDDPTGGVVRPPKDDRGGEPVAAALVITAAEPDEPDVDVGDEPDQEPDTEPDPATTTALEAEPGDVPAVGSPGDDLVILPLDSEIGEIGETASRPPDIPADTEVDVDEVAPAAVATVA